METQTSNNFMNTIPHPPACRLPVILRGFITCVFLLASYLSAEALDIIRTDDPSLNNTTIISTADANAARVAFDYAAAQFEALYRNPITIRITLKVDSGPGGASSQFLQTTKSLWHGPQRADLPCADCG